MKTLYESFVAAFSMFSKIPMPQIDWNEKNMRYSFIFFPVVGAVIAFVLYFLFLLLEYFRFSPVFFAAAAVFINVMITGGVHLDGYCDTTDALNSHKDQEEKLRILKDPNVGAFALIYTSVILLLQFAAWYETYLKPDFFFLVLVSFVLSRSMAALAVVCFPCVRKTGLASIFAGYASKKTVRIISCLIVLLCVAAMLYVSMIVGITAVLFIMLSFYLFNRMVQKHFGGITGDLAGFYIVVSETGILLISVIAGGVRL
ncbi:MULTISPECIES: adenosylcobinamide-GDP ribazoletransferase [unclassified Dehalobacter]|uniref:adenosylcobinamide-GDP ribazoletransferase n=1 Tax=unclassified Dehalobacter TaxID=2635733 RepID=UPI00037951F9|nr:MULTISPECIES: adenosylcobinamide-GDP ribazoletransferase [unclassified Dehalobacter]RJE48565.1 cobalamin 5'-phosphate synthase [Dehalobacter sp. MCB1]TCX46700.1 adenosylcobinamide-GDP ribazoletransferase [Dehalobacter sp. 14DCB1]TCX51269.1 adenosylcobinamide-GDP ribazoletransferase [Dehalobacter sp. 12DCB1]